MPSRVALIDGFAGMFRLIPAVPVTVAVVVSGAPRAPAANASARTTSAMVMMIRCLMMSVFSLKGLVVLDKPTFGGPGRNHGRRPV